MRNRVLSLAHQFHPTATLEPQYEGHEDHNAVRVFPNDGTSWSFVGFDQDKYVNVTVYDENMDEIVDVWGNPNDDEVEQIVRTALAHHMEATA